MRRRYNVLEWHRGHVPLRRVGDVPPRRRWVFHLRRTCDIVGADRKTSLRRRHDVLLLGGNMCTIYHIRIWSFLFLILNIFIHFLLCLLLFPKTLIICHKITNIFTTSWYCTCIFFFSLFIYLFSLLFTIQKGFSKSYLHIAT